MDRPKQLDRLYPPRKSRIYYHLTQLRLAYQRAIDEFSADLQGANLVDYGCGDAPYRSLFEGICASYEGHDLENNSRADKTLTTEGLLCIDAHSVGVVLSSQVLEHVEDPDRYLRECCRVIRDSGLLFLSTHGVWQYHPDPTDYWRWTSAGLHKIIQSAGFDVLKIVGIVGPAATGIQLWQDATLPKLPRFLRGTVSFVCQVLMKFSDSKCDEDQRNRDASVYLCIARKIPDQYDPVPRH